MNPAWVEAYGATVARWMSLEGDYGTLNLDEQAWCEMMELVERARVVGVLDAWRTADPERSIEEYDDNGLSVVLLRGDDLNDESFRGPTPDAARAAAAKAIEAGEV